MNNTTLAKRLISGSALRTLLLGCNIIVSFFMMPFLIHSLGDRWYGFWALIGSFMGYYGFLDIGLTSAVSRFVSRAYGQKDLKEMNIVINTSLVIFSIIGTIAICITIVASLMAPYFIENTEDISLFQKIIFILGIDIAISFPMRAFAGVLTSKIRFDISTYIQLIKLALRTIFIVIFIKAGFGLIALAIITFIVNLISYSLNFFFVKREFPEMKLKISFVERDRFKTLFSYSKYTLLSQIADQLRFKVDTFVIAGFLDLSLVTTYTIAARLIEYFVQLITNSIGILIPVFSQYEGKGDFASIRKLLLSATNLSATITFFVGGCIIFYAKYFIRVWMGPEYNASYSVIVILCTAVMLGLMQNPSIGLLYGISKHKFYAFSNIGEGILNLLLSVILVKFYGINGVALGTLIEMIVFKIIIQPIYISRIIEIPFWIYYRAIFMPLLKLILPMVTFFYLIQGRIQYTYLSIFIFASIQLLIFMPFIYFIVLGTDEKRFIQLGIGSKFWFCRNAKKQ